MSEYMNFFIKGTDRYYPIGSYNRASFIFSAFYSFAPYNQVRALDEKTINSVINDTKDALNELDEREASYKNRIEIIKGCSNSVEEKMEQIEIELELLKETEQIKEYLQEVIDFCNFLSGIIEEISFGEYYKDVGNIITADSYVYVGIEVPNWPQFDEVEEYK